MVTNLRFFTVDIIIVRTRALGYYHMWSRTCLSFGSTLYHPRFWWGSCCLVLWVQCCVLCIIICLFVFLFFSHGIVSLFSIYEFDCPSGIFHPSLSSSIKLVVLIFVWGQLLTVDELFDLQQTDLLHSYVCI